MSWPPLAGFLSFASAGMLVWGAAALIPLVLHLLSRKARAVTSWAAMEFLQAALRKNARRLRLERWLLLSWRVLLLLLLALALAQPRLSRWAASSGASPPRGRTHTVLVLDASYSMGYRGSQRTTFEEAQEQTRQLLDAGRQGDAYSLILMAEPTRTIIGDVAFDPADVQQELDDLRVTDGGASLEGALEAIAAVLHAAKLRYPGLSERRVCFFTDLGRSTWDAVATPACRQRLAELEGEAQLLLWDVGSPGRANLAVTRLSADTWLPVVNDRLVLQAELENFGPQETPRRRVQLLMDGTVVDEKTLQLAPGERVTTSFALAPDAAGEHMAQLLVEEDALEIDNRRWLSLPIRQAVRVLCVEGKQDAGRYVALALAPQRQAAGRIQVERAPESALLERDLLEYDCLWLCDVGRFDRAEANLLDRYVRRGGGLVITLGDQVQLENYNQELGGELAPARLLPAQLLEVVAATGVRFDPLEYGHELLAPFRGHQRAGLLTAPVARYVRVKPYQPETASVALAFTTGDPAIVEESIGRGRCLLLTTAASLNSQDRASQPPVVWSGLAAWPSFPPLVQRMLELATRGRGEPRNVLVGEALAADLPADAAADAVTLTTPSGQQRRVPVRGNGTARNWVFTNTLRGGVYQAHRDPESASVRLFAVNVDTRESDLRRFDRALLPALADPQEARASPAGGTDPASGRPLFRWLLAALLALVVGETLLAWRLNRSRDVVPA